MSNNVQAKHRRRIDYGTLMMVLSMISCFFVVGLIVGLEIR